MRVMAYIACAAIAAGAMPSAALAAPAKAPGPAATMSTFINSFNKGDATAAEATNTADVVIIDEFPPHRWVGPGAFQAWAADLEKDGKATGKSNERVKLGKPGRVQVDGDTAYVVAPATFLYTQHGKAMVEPAHFAVSLINGADGWKINGWAWAGTIPQAAAPKPAPAAAAPAATPPAAK